MGWTFLYDCPTKASLIRYLTEPKIRTWVSEVDGKAKTLTILKHAVVGTNIWAVHELKVEGEPDTRYVALYLTSREKGVGWGCKDMDSSAGPYEVNCPLSYLDDLTEPVNDWDREWRERVRKYHAERAKKRKAAKALQPGDIITIYGKEYTVYEVLPRGQLRVRSKENGIIYRARPNQLTLKAG